MRRMHFRGRLKELRERLGERNHQSPSTFYFCFRASRIYRTLSCPALVSLPFLFNNLRIEMATVQFNHYIRTTSSTRKKKKKTDSTVWSQKEGFAGVKQKNERVRGAVMRFLSSTFSAAKKITRLGGKERKRESNIRWDKDRLLVQDTSWSSFR